ncbi:MAG: FAD:protein FMN transferase, partial [Roseimicrobium sp.]
GPLMDIYRDAEGGPRIPLEEEVACATARVGDAVFDVEDTGIATTLVEGIRLDLGALGKGYALDQAVTILANHGIERALLNAGDSTILALEPPEGDSGWIVNVGNREPIALSLRQRAISASGFAVKGAHIMDPRLRQPVPARPERVWAIAPTAALSDALSTAFAVMTRAETVAFCSGQPEIVAILD